MATARIIAGNRLKIKSKKPDKKLYILLICNLVLSTIILMKLFGVL